MKHPLKHVIEYIFVRIMATLFRSLPYKAALFLGFCVARFAFLILRGRVNEAKRRIREVFGDRFLKSEIDRIAWISWRNFIFTMVEAIRLSVSSRDWVQAVVDSNQTHIKINNWSKTGKGGIIATGHTGSWEMAILACLAYDIPLFSLGARQKNKLVDDFINRSRAGTGFETVLRNASVLKTIMRKIKEGKVLAILSDVRGKTDALPIKFLGKTANVAEGMGFIAHQTNVPVFPTIITRIGWGLHSYRVYDPIFPDSKAGKRDDALRITQSFFDILSKHVENEPEQWFWFNKRWIFDPLKKDKAESQESGVGIQNQGNPDKNGGNDNEDSSTSSAS
jgi:KDO2-lipid IV(A) lauroyltransferase